MFSPKDQALEEYRMFKEDVSLVLEDFQDIPVDDVYDEIESLWAGAIEDAYSSHD